VDAPIGDTSQYFCDFQGDETFANLNIVGVNLIFWDAAVDGNQLPMDTVLTHEMQIWVSQGLGSCAERLPVYIITECDPSITLTKSAQNSFCRADETIEFELTITNSGNVPLTNVIIVDENIDTTIAPINLIEPGDSVIIPVIHTIVSFDRLYGVVINTATVTAYAPNDDSNVDDVSDDLDDPTSNEDPTVVYQDSDCDGVIDIEDIDDDNDGILDIIENNGIDPTVDADGDGVSQYLDLDDNDATVGADPDNIPNLDTDGDNIPNHLDIDADGDGIPDNVEGQDTIDYIIPTYEDLDANGLDDVYETSPGSGEGISPQDTDGDTILDYLDIDSDNDNVPDYIEGHDDNHNGILDGDEVNGVTGVDSDNDGLDDAYEGEDLDDPYDVNDEIEMPRIDLPDTDLDVADGGDVDYRDDDDDNDGVPTSEEDNNHDGNFANDDCDSDETPDYLDSDNCHIVMPEGFSPNDGDSDNPVYFVDGLVNLYPNFKLEIYDRYGNIVYDYTHNGDKDADAEWWDGISTGRWTLNQDVKVPAGTYFYILYPNEEGVKSQTGWLYLNK
jgi:gliding motility-associated-like protein